MKNKNRIAGLRQENITYKSIFAILKIENVKTPLSAVKRFGGRFEIKGTVNRKVGSGRPRAFKIKDDHRVEMTILNVRKKNFVDHRKHLLSTTYDKNSVFFTLLGFVNLEK